jgi:large subunit ribosomal protein L6
MSRIGAQPISLPSNVTLNVEENKLTASGPKGSLQINTLPGIKVKITDGKIILTPERDDPDVRAKHGLMRSLIANMVTGVSQGFSKKLEVNGVGYRVSAQDQQLKFNLGYSHEVTYKVPAGVLVTVEQNIITVSGIDKQQVGQVAAEIRALKKPEPYKGKGIKYVDEKIIRKSGKSGKEAAT